MFHLHMQHVGSIAGVGDTFVFGLAQHTVTRDRVDTVYLNLAGPATSVESVWARLVERHTTLFVPHDQPRSAARYIRHGGLSSGETPYLRYQRRIPGLAIDHLILLDRRFVEVEYNEVGVAFLFDAPDMHLKLTEHVRQCVNLPVFPDWAERLAEIGRMARLVRPLACLGGQPVYLVELDRTRWEHHIALRVEREELPWPGDAAEPKPLTVIEAEEDEPPGNPTPAAPEVGFTVTHERSWTWVKFDAMPPETVRDALKRTGFCWGRQRNAWYAQTLVMKGDIEQCVFKQRPD